MTSTAGYGRTGNYYISTRRAMGRAHACKTRLSLPIDDEGGGVFHPANNTRFLDFSSRPGLAHPLCFNSSIGAGLTGNARDFYLLSELPSTTSADSLFYAAYRTGPGNSVEVELDVCMRWYIGLCDPSFCGQRTQHLKNKLVAHIRQGDVYKANFSSEVHAGYGQPPFAFYLAGFNFARWSQIVVVAQPTNDTNPVWDQLHILDASGFVKYPIKFQADTWSEDFKTLMCATNVITSRSTLNEVLKLGLARCFFSWTCFPWPHSHTQVYRIPIAHYTPFSKHDNSAEQWVDTLLHTVSKPESC